jgi:anti-sigma B factor antagonist
MKGSTDDRLSREANGDHVAGRIETPPAPFDICRVDHPLGVVFTLGGELDLATAPALQEQVDRAVRGRRAVVIDLSGLRFIDSSGLHVLLQVERQLRASGGQLVLVHGPRAVRRVFEVAGLDCHFEFSESSGAAVRTVLERRSASRPISKAGTNRQTTADFDRKRRGVM